ncbi:MAG: hypothetical protein ACM3YM_11685 [Sphingomonadales bacterium]
MNGAGPAPTFARFALGRLTSLAERLRKPDVTEWLESQPKVDVDGTTMWIIGGDQLIDEDEAKLNYARRNGLIDEQTVSRLQAEYRPDNPDVIAIDAD